MPPDNGSRDATISKDAALSDTKDSDIKDCYDTDKDIMDHGTVFADDGSSNNRDSIDAIDDATGLDTAKGEPADVPAFDLPPLTTLAQGFHVKPVIPAAGQSFSMIMASDPQLWWNSIGNKSGISDAEVEKQNLLHISAMNELIAGKDLPKDQAAPVGVVMNGDLTEYGRWKQWDAYYRLYSGVNAPIWDGLGNHDYENNNILVSDGCAINIDDFNAWNAACDAHSKQTLWGEPACTVVTNVRELEAWCAMDTMRRMRYWIKAHAAWLYDHDKGSAAYSWDMGDYHFIQLHDYADYEVPKAHICSSIPWLQKDLKAAFLRGKHIVINMHRPIKDSLKQYLKGYQYNIVGIFFGHFHNRAGYTGNFEVDGVKIPEFYCGSVQWNMFSLAFFGSDRLVVTVIDTRTGHPVYHASSSEYDNGAHAAAPFTYIYPENNCPAGQIPQEPGGPCITPDLPTPAIKLCY